MFIDLRHPGKVNYLKNFIKTSKIIFKIAIF